MKISKVLND